MKKLTLTLAALALAACAPENKTIYGQRDIIIEPPTIPKYDPIPVQKTEWIVVDGGNTEAVKPELDIVFIMDNSDSMKAAQDNLSRNINRFVDKFHKNRSIDYRIGVLSVWDSSERFATLKKDSYGKGELRWIRDGEGRKLKSRFVSRFRGVESILKSTLKIGVAPYAEGGPEVEEIFSPLSEALKKIGRGDTNEGFFRENAQLAVVLITDADDTSTISPDQMARELVEFKKGRREKVVVYGALVSQKDSDSVKDWGLRVHPKYHPECFDQKTIPAKSKKAKPRIVNVNNGKCKDGFGPANLEKFILLANADSGTPAEIRENHIMSLTQKDFGNDLAKMGTDITARTLAKEILL